ERCGNANLVSIIPTLKLKPDFAERFDIGVSDDKLSELVHVSRALDEILNRAPNRHAPYVGESAFATKAGIHASAIMKELQGGLDDPAGVERGAPNVVDNGRSVRKAKSYEHVAPDAVGNRRKLLVSDQSGKSNVVAE